MSVSADSGYEDDAMCAYKFEFSVNAGPGDILELFIVTAKFSGLSFAVGSSLLTATTGPKIESPEGQLITVPYPQALFVTFFNTGSSGELLLTYKYIDQEPEDAKEL